MKWRRIPLAEMLTGLLIAGAGCSHPPPPQAQLGCYLSSPQDLRRIHRVVLLELTQDSSVPPIARDMTESLFRAAQARNLFHIDQIARDDPLCRDLPLDGRGVYTIKDLMAMREALDCDAILFGRVTHYRSYPRMQIGLYVRLLDLQNGKLVWAVEHIWDSTDKATETRIKEFFESQMRSGYEPAQWELVTQSPKAFQKFVAFEIGQTLAPSQGDTQRIRAPGDVPAARL